MARKRVGKKTSVAPTTRRTPFTKRQFNARPDTVDFRDRLYVPTSVEVPQRIGVGDHKRALQRHRRSAAKILDQGAEGACTGFALAAVVHFLLQTRKVAPDAGAVSPHMLYAMARRYDEWPGEGYEGSSARGAMKGWYKHGVCTRRLWTATAKGAAASDLDDDRAGDALQRPLGAYYRVNHKDLVAMHAAIAEVGILYATASVHDGWDEPNRRTGLIEFQPGSTGGHAFAIVGYDERGFWIQNSWGRTWGAGGFGRLTYADWLVNGTDVWVARLAVPIELREEMRDAGADPAGLARQIGAYSQRDLRPHVVSIGNDGKLREGGLYSTTPQDLRTILTDDLPRITSSWSHKRLLLYAHGGLVGEQPAIQRIADYRQTLLDHEVYPLGFVWRTDLWSTLTNILRDALSLRRTEGILDAARDFLLDRLDDTLEPLARPLGKPLWDEMKENASRSAALPDGGARQVLGILAGLTSARRPELHVAAHSAGAIFQALIVQLLTTPKNEIIDGGPLDGEAGFGLDIASCTLWAPACTIELFKNTYLPAIHERRIRRFTLFTLTDPAEQDDHCAHVYHKSLLYLVSNAFEKRPRIPLLREGTPLLGMAKFVAADNALVDLFGGDDVDAQWVQAPNRAAEPSSLHSTARHHGDFDDDKPTVLATLARILDQESIDADFRFERSGAARADRRRAISSQVQA